MDDWGGCLAWAIGATLVLAAVIALVVYVILPIVAICATIGLLIGLWHTSYNYVAIVRETFGETGVQNERE